MRLSTGAVALLVAGLPAVVAAQAPPPASPAASKDFVVERVTIPELKKLMEADKVLVVDVRGADDYKSGHIPGSISAPLGEIETHAEKLKSAKKDIVTYCT
jgi:hydroxyacylglutathione hydrolase